MTDSRVRSVADVNRMARSLIEAETLEQFFWLTGHVEGYTKSDRGHIYFRLSDEGKSVRCVLFEDKAGDLQFELRNALTVEVYGDMRFYEAWGNIEIRVLKARLTDGQRAEMRQLLSSCAPKAYILRPSVNSLSAFGASASSPAAAAAPSVTLKMLIARPLMA